MGKPFRRPRHHCRRPDDAVAPPEHQRHLSGGTGAPIELRGRVLRALKRGATALALLGTSAMPRGAAATTNTEERKRDAVPAPSASELGWFGASVGAASVMKLETQL